VANFFGTWSLRGGGGEKKKFCHRSGSHIRSKGEAGGGISKDNAHKEGCSRGLVTGICFVGREKLTGSSAVQGKETCHGLFL